MTSEFISLAVTERQQKYTAESAESSVSISSLIQRIKEKNKGPAPEVRQPSSYNPERYGAAYYFTPSGEKLRHIQIYTMNESAHSKNYDYLPTRSDEQCNKIYPEVSRRGSEGRTDSFSTAYSYLEHSQEDVFYDISCQFEEYCLNREPGFGENTRFWHDISVVSSCVVFKERMLLAVQLGISFTNHWKVNRSQTDDNHYAVTVNRPKEGITLQAYKDARHGNDLQFICTPCEQINWPAPEPEPIVEPAPEPIVEPAPEPVEVPAPEPEAINIRRNYPNCYYLDMRTVSRSASLACFTLDK
ncbi:unnamed protein product [Mytilus coruscus]|uniref:Uncharacterized protein n=1 Tax=Mytilus coruscus TaxID=42192 RepID=A0A6J8E666_MYTCO|nr:unnamed protein product [Mytilus coruscus]